MNYFWNFQQPYTAQSSSSSIIARSLPAFSSHQIGTKQLIRSLKMISKEDVKSYLQLSIILHTTDNYPITIDRFLSLLPKDMLNNLNKSVIRACAESVKADIFFNKKTYIEFFLKFLIEPDSLKLIPKAFGKEFFLDSLLNLLKMITDDELDRYLYIKTTLPSRSTSLKEPLIVFDNIEQFNKLICFTPKDIKDMLFFKCIQDEEYSHFLRFLFSEIKQLTTEDNCTYLDIAISFDNYTAVSETLNYFLYSIFKDSVTKSSKDYHLNSKYYNYFITKVFSFVCNLTENYNHSKNIYAILDPIFDSFIDLFEQDHLDSFKSLLFKNLENKKGYCLERHFDDLLDYFKFTSCEQDLEITLYLYKTITEPNLYKKLPRQLMNVKLCEQKNKSNLIDDIMTNCLDLDDKKESKRKFLSRNLHNHFTKK